MTEYYQKMCVVMLLDASGLIGKKEIDLFVLSQFLLCTNAEATE